MYAVRGGLNHRLTVHRQAVPTSTHVINSNLISNLPYDPVKDYAPIGTFSRVKLVLVLHPSVPARNLQEYAKIIKTASIKLEN